METQLTIKVAAQLAGVTRRQIDYWVKTGVIEPAMTASRGKAGNVMLFNLDNIFQLRILRTLLELGFSFQELRRLTDEESLVGRDDKKGEERPPTTCYMSRGRKLSHSTSGEPVKMNLARIIEEVKEGSLKEFWVFAPKEGLVGIDVGASYSDTKKELEELVKQEQKQQLVIRNVPAFKPGKKQKAINAS